MSGFLQRCRRCPQLTPKGLCPDCAAAAERERGTRHERGLDNNWARQSAAAVRAWVAGHGWICPGDGMDVGEHPATDLTGDHDVARAFGGDASTGITVRCRSCNSRRGARMPVRMPVEMARAVAEAERELASDLGLPDDLVVEFDLRPRELFA
jgi:5-methylcytosine-specific restriction endonuclease McrA